MLLATCTLFILIRDDAMIKASDFGFEVVKNNSTNDKNSMFIMWSSCTYIVEICYNNVILYEALIEY